MANRTTLSPAKLVRCQPTNIDDAFLKVLFNKLPKTELQRRIGTIDDPFLKAHAKRIASAAFITR